MGFSEYVAFSGAILFQNGKVDQRLYVSRIPVRLESGSRMRKQS
jgi:hypothetical protein